MGKFKIGDIAVCIIDCLGVSAKSGLKSHNNPPKKDEEFLVVGYGSHGFIKLGGVGVNIDGCPSSWVDSKFIDAIDFIKEIEGLEVYDFVIPEGYKLDKTEGKMYLSLDNEVQESFPQGKLVI